MDDNIYAKAYEMGLKPRRTAKGWSILCPRHEDRRQSAQVFSNDGWAVCYAGCGRWNFMGYHGTPREENYQVKVTEATDYNTVDYFEFWLGLEPLSEDLKGIPSSHLNSLGWRKLSDGNNAKLPQGIFIPAFSTTRTTIPFCQVRHDSGDRRFSFPSRVKPLVFGFESLEKCKTFVPFTEGNSDRATLELLGIPCLGFPSGSSGGLLRKLGEWANTNGKILVACSDSDSVGDKFLSVLDGIAPYIDNRCKWEKDWNDAYNSNSNKTRKELQWLMQEK